MVIQGRSIEKEYSIEQMSELFIKHMGIVANVAAEMQCERRTVYDYLDIYPELQEVRIRAAKRYGIAKVENADVVLDKLIEKVDEDPSNAFRSAQYILNKSKYSPYYEEVKTDGSFSLESLDETIESLS